MLLGGLWHGASWNFLVWGALHGTALAGERITVKHFPNLRLPKWAATGLTFTFVCVGWVFFRADSLTAAIEYLGSMFALQPVLKTASLFSILGGPAQQPFYLLALLLAASVVSLGCQTWDWTQSLTWRKATLVLALGWVAIVSLLTQDYNPFIYFIF